MEMEVLDARLAKGRAESLPWRLITDNMAAFFESEKANVFEFSNFFNEEASKGKKAYRVSPKCEMNTFDDKEGKISLGVMLNGTFVGISYPVPPLKYEVPYWECPKLGEKKFLEEIDEVLWEIKNEKLVLIHINGVHYLENFDLKADLTEETLKLVR
jgi:hypothetical protein